MFCFSYGNVTLFLLFLIIDVPTVKAVPSEDVIREFKEKNGIMQEFEDIDIQRISDGRFFTVENEKLETVDLPEYSVVDKIRAKGGNRFRRGSTLRGQPYLVVLDRESQTVEEVAIRESNGSVTQILPVEDGWYAVVPSSSYDSSKFPIYAKAVDWVHPFEERRGSRQLQSGPCESWDQIEVAVEYDATFCAELGSVATAEDEVERIVALASFMFYETEGLCFKLQLSHLDGFCESSNDPYNLLYNSEETDGGKSGCDDSIGMLWSMSGFWAKNRKEVESDVVHIFQGRPFTDLGGITVACAFIDVICNANYGFAVHSMYWGEGSTSLTRVVIFAHELGHNAGSKHLAADPGVEYVMEPFVSNGADGFSTMTKSVLRGNTADRSCVENVEKDGDGDQPTSQPSKTPEPTATTSMAPTTTTSMAPTTTTPTAPTTTTPMKTPSPSLRPSPFPSPETIANLSGIKQCSLLCRIWDIVVAILQLFSSRQPTTR